MELKIDWFNIKGLANRAPGSNSRRKYNRDYGEYDTQLNDTQHNDTRHNVTQYNDTQYNGTQELDIKHNNK